MDDEHTPPEPDARLRAAFSPDEETTRRIVARALTDSGAPRGPLRPWRYVGALAVLVLLLGISAWQRQRRPAAVAVAVAPTLPLAITGQGSMVVAESPDGRRWIVGPPPEARAGGNYVIVLER
jgi:hypothetical protein